MLISFDWWKVPNVGIALLVAIFVVYCGLWPGLVCCLVRPVPNELVLIEMPVHTLAPIGVFGITSGNSADVDKC